MRVSIRTALPYRLLRSRRANASRAIDIEINVIGRTILHYRIVEKIGEGGMGVVYKAEDTKLGRFVAIKFLPAALMADDDARRRFINEARSAAALNHPNIAVVHDFQ